MAHGPWLLAVQGRSWRSWLQRNEIRESTANGERIPRLVQVRRSIATFLKTDGPPSWFYALPIAGALHRLWTA